MNTLVKRSLILAGLVTSIIGFSAPGVFAQDAGQSAGGANGFRVSPVRSELSINKGESTKLTLSIANPTNVATTAKAVINDFIASDDETGTPRLILDETAAAPKNSFKSLVKDVSDMPLGPNESKDVDVTISVPEDASSGGYYGAVRFVPVSDTQSGNVGLTASVGTIVLVTVPGNLSQKLDLVQMSATQNGKAKSFLTSGNVSILTRLKNSGDIHVQPFGHVEVKNMFGKIVASYEFNNVEPRDNILPGSVRKFENQLDGKKWFGRYTISANIGYSQGGGDILSAKTTFWYLPTWFLYVLIAVVLAVVGGVYFLVRRFNGRSRHASK